MKTLLPALLLLPGLACAQRPALNLPLKHELPAAGCCTLAFSRVVAVAGQLHSTGALLAENLA